MQEAEKALAYDHWQRVLTDGAFEDALAALRDVVSHLEAGSLRLDDAVRCFEVGSLLARRCERLLDEAELRITRLSEDDDADKPGFQTGFLND
jgi:exodeoxyribonuclease VII small subunit